MRLAVPVSADVVRGTEPSRSNDKTESEWNEKTALLQAEVSSLREELAERDSSLREELAERDTLVQVHRTRAAHASTAIARS